MLLFIDNSMQLKTRKAKHLAKNIYQKVKKKC